MIFSKRNEFYAVKNHSTFQVKFSVEKKNWKLAFWYPPTKVSKTFASMCDFVGIFEDDIRMGDDSLPMCLK